VTTKHWLVVYWRRAAPTRCTTNLFFSVRTGLEEKRPLQAALWHAVLEAAADDEWRGKTRLEPRGDNIESFRSKADLELKRILAVTTTRANGRERKNLQFVRCKILDPQASKLVGRGQAKEKDGAASRSRWAGGAVSDWDSLGPGTRGKLGTYGDDERVGPA
jgi:hypothetical protein